MKAVGKPVAGKTGTTNDEKDVWFIGFTPEIAVGVYLGYDKPRHIRRGATGGQLAAPIVRDFLIAALADRPAVPFRVPPGIKLIRIDPKTGLRAGPGQNAILEAFKPGTAPPDSNSIIGVAHSDGSPVAVSPDVDRAVRTGLDAIAAAPASLRYGVRHFRSEPQLGAQAPERCLRFRTEVSDAVTLPSAARYLAGSVARSPCTTSSTCTSKISVAFPGTMPSTPFGP